MFKSLFAGVSGSITCDVFNVVDGEYPVSTAYDAWLITGSKADAFSDEAWIVQLRKYVIERYESGHKLLGVCFGHQILASALGGKTERASAGWGIGIQSFDVVEKRPWMQPGLRKLSLLMSHRDQVSVLPPGAATFASSSYCPNAGYVIDDQVIGVQGHPEFDTDFSRLIYAKRKENCSRDHYAESMQSLELPHDGLVVAQWFVNFVERRPVPINK